MEALQRSMPNDVSKVEVGGAQYNMVLNERGGIVDDLINYRLGEHRWLCVPNAANVHKVHAAVLGPLHHLAPELDFLVDGQDEVVAGIGLALDASEPPAARVHGDEHLAGLAAQFAVELEPQAEPLRHLVERIRVLGY